MRKIISTIIILLISISIASCEEATTISFANPNPDYCEINSEDGVYVCEKTSTSYFDTTILLKLYYTEGDAYSIDEVFDYFMDTLETYHQLFDKYNAYDGVFNVYNINQLEMNTEAVLDDVLFEAITFALENQDLVIADETELFNIALDPVLEVWHDARDESNCDSTYELGVSWCTVPYEAIDTGVFNTNSDSIILDSTLKTISFSEENMGIDLGGFAKGYISNIIAEHLNSLNVTYLLNAGNSNIIANKSNPTRDTGLYYIALIEPNVDFHVSNTYYQYIKIPEDMSVVTSGNYQRYFKEIDAEGNYTGDVYHHIIDPRTNYPGGEAMSVTVIYPDSALADIYSTAIYLLTIEEGLAFVNSTENLEAVWYDSDGLIITSDGFAQYDYQLE